MKDFDDSYSYLSKSKLLEITKSEDKESLMSLIDKGYCKIPKHSIVITQDEYLSLLSTKTALNRAQRCVDLFLTHFSNFIDSESKFTTELDNSLLDRIANLSVKIKKEIEDD